MGITAVLLKDATKESLDHRCHVKLRVLRISNERMAFSKPSANSADDTKALEEHTLSKWCENRSHEKKGH
jgi:hypothetical protein